MDVDVERMIIEISGRQELWDTSTEAYKDKHMKREAWKQVCTALFEDFENKPKEERIGIERVVISKWRTVRDGYVKWKKKEKELQKSNTGKKSCHKYVYADLLGFLGKCMQMREIEDNAVIASTSSDLIDTAEFVDQEKSLAPPSTVPREMHGKKRKTAIEKEVSDYLRKASELMVSRQSSYDDDEDMSFFRAMLPSVKKLNESQKFYFRMQLMANLQMLAASPNVSHNQSCQVPTVPFYQPSTNHLSSSAQQQSSHSASFYQPQYPSTLSVGQSQQHQSTSLLHQPPLIHQPSFQSQQPSHNQPQFSPHATNSSDSNLTYVDFKAEGIDELV